MQNKCLRAITGAYKATNIKVLEAEAGVAPLDIHLDRMVLRSKDTSKCSKIIESTKARRRRKLRGQRGKERRPGATPGLAKKEWAELERERLMGRERLQMESTRHEEMSTSCSSWSKKWSTQKWEERWKEYRDSVPEALRTPAQEDGLRHRGKLHVGLRKAESSLAIQLRTEKVGFAAFLHARRVPEVLSPACQCGWRRQDSKHIIMFCPNRTMATRNRMYEEAGTRRYQELLSTKKGLRAVARWVMGEGLLHQFSLAKEQVDGAEEVMAREVEEATDGEEEVGSVEATD